MTPLEKARRRFGITFEALAMAGGGSSRAARYHCEGRVAPSVITAIGYSIYLQACNRAAGHQILPEQLTVEALFHTKKARCHRTMRAPTVSNTQPL